VGSVSEGWAVATAIAARQRLEKKETPTGETHPAPAASISHPFTDLHPPTCISIPGSATSASFKLPRRRTATVYKQSVLSKKLWQRYLGFMLQLHRWQLQR